MKLAITRTLDDLRPVLMNKNVSGLEEVYWVFSDLNYGKFVNLTIISDVRLGSEFSKTFGHYHSQKTPETYQVVAGEGVLVLQQAADDFSVLERVILIKAVRGDKLVIDPKYGHSWSNVGKGPLILIDDWSFGHKPEDYQLISKFNGMGYYLVEKNGKLETTANNNYKKLPPPEWLDGSQLKI